jgi:integrase
MEVLEETKTKQRYIKVKSTFPQIWKFKKGKYDRWLVNGRSKEWGLNIRKEFNSETLCRKYVQELDQQIKTNRSGVSEIPYFTNPEIEKLIDRLKPWGKSLQDSVEFYIQSLESQLKQSLIPPIKELCERWYLQRKNSTLKPLRNRSIAELNSLHKFIQHHFGKLKPSQVTKEGIESVLTKSFGGNLTKNRRRKFIRSFFKWCIENKYISSNPTDGIQVKVDKTEVEIWSPEQISQVLSIVEEKYPSLLGFYVLCIFGGLRPSESQRVEWKDINCEGKEIYVKPEGKTGSRRFVLSTTPNGETETLWVWLEHFRQIQPEGTFNPSTNHVNLQKKIRKQVSNWKPDVLRHSFGTYYYNLIHDLGKVVFVMGNGEQICKRHYLREVKKSWMEEFWKLRPKSNSPKSDGELTEQIPLSTS